MKYFCLDIESTGISDDDKIVEIGWVEVEFDGGVGMIPNTEFSSLINPERPINAAASGVNGVRQEDVIDAPTIDEIDFPTGEVILIGHNIKFDIRYVENYMNITNSICTLLMARRLVTESPDHKLPTLSAFLNLPRRNTHRALDDVYTTVFLLDHLYELCEFDSPEELLKWLSVPFVYKTMNFGKYKGKRIVDLPKSYLNWLSGIYLDIDMRETLIRTFAGSK